MREIDLKKQIQKCRKCGEWKPLTEFTKHKKMKYGIDTICLKCNCKSVKKHYDENAEQVLEYQRKYYIENREKCIERTANTRNKIVDIVGSFKDGKKCIICGNNDANLLSFHHRNPKEKKFKVSGRNSISEERLIKEMNKCDLICHNCHRDLHHNEVILKEDASEYTFRRRKFKEWFDNIKSEKGCAICGDKRYWILDCHHINGEEKEHELFRMIHNMESKSRILYEFNKCDVLCSNCHQKFHLENKKGS